jgi:hypothetical protein
MLAVMLNTGAVHIAWLLIQTEKTKLTPDSPVPKRVIQETMVSFVKKFGKEKAQIVFKSGADMLTDLLGVDTWKVFRICAGLAVVVCFINTN